MDTDYYCCHPKIAFKRLREKLNESLDEIKFHTQDIDVKKLRRKCCSWDTVRNTLPILKWLPKYRLRHLQGDIIAGLTVGLTFIPQSLADAVIAGLSPEYGLYSAFMGCFVYTVFGTGKDINIGPTALISLLVAEFGHSPVNNNPTYAILLAFISGVIYLTMGLLHVGFLGHFISEPVISAFINAASIAIIWTQIKNWFGLREIPSHFIDAVISTFKKIPESRLWDFLMGFVCLTALCLLKKLKDVHEKLSAQQQLSITKKVLKHVVFYASTARYAVVVIISGGVAAGLLRGGLLPFTLTGKVTSGLPPFKPPNFTLTSDNVTVSTAEIFQDIGVGFPIVALLGVIEMTAVGKAFARRNNYVIDANQELLALGITNILTSFVSGYAVTASLTRSAVNSQSGVMTQAGGLWAALLILLSLAFLTPLFYYIPTAALAAIIIIAMVDMIDFSVLPRIWRVKKMDVVVWFVTFIICLLAGIEWGIIAGVGLSFLLLLYPWARPIVEKQRIDTPHDGEFIVLIVNRGMQFPGAELFAERLAKEALSDENLKPVILNMQCISNSDYTTMETNVMKMFNRAEMKQIIITSSVQEAITLLRERRVCAGRSEDSTNESPLESTSTTTSESPDNKHHTSISIINNNDLLTGNMPKWFMDSRKAHYSYM